MHHVLVVVVDSESTVVAAYVAVDRQEACAVIAGSVSP